MDEDVNLTYQDHMRAEMLSLTEHLNRLNWQKLNLHTVQIQKMKLI